MEEIIFLILFALRRLYDREIESLVGEGMQLLFKSGGSNVTSGEHHGVLFGWLE